MGGATTTRSVAAPTIAVDALVDRLTEEIHGEIRFDSGTRAAYSTDGSNYRQIPLGVIVPRTVEDGARAIEICRDADVPLVSRGGGTSLAGQCTNTAVMIDWAKYCNRLLSVDPKSRTATVEPGIVLDVLNRELAQHNLEYGPRPSTHPSCTLGGMIGNNSCGATAQRTGKVVDNIRRLEVMLYDGTRFWCGPTDDDEYTAIERRGDPTAALYRRLRDLRDRYADDIRAGYPQIPRRVSGYNLDSLLPEQGFDIAKLLVGSESTLVTVLRAEIELVPVLDERILVILGYDSVGRAADAVPDALKSSPIALEGFDHRLLVDERRKNINSEILGRLPDGKAFLMIQFGGDTRDEVRDAAHRLLSDVGRSEDDSSVAVLDDPSSEEELWRVREAGLGATAHVPGHHDTWEGWEDSAVAPERLGDYLRDLERLYERYGLVDDTAPSLYGHFGQGCVHTRIPFELRTADGVDQYHRFLVDAAHLVSGYDGSLSGEHGDGQARGELLPIMFGDTLVRAFGELKSFFDPGGRMNPGKVVDPAPATSHLRLGADWEPFAPTNLFFDYPEDDGSFIKAANRCVGVGKCRQHGHRDGTVMCPSYQATAEEEHSTRGRARLLFEMLDGHADGTITDGWRSTEVKQALDLCLSCKGCKSDCPVNVDMATYKAEFLAHHYQGRIRPRSHYALGWLPLAAGAVSGAHAARGLNRLTDSPRLSRMATRAAGLDDREIPKFAETTLQRWWHARGVASRASGARAPLARYLHQPFPSACRASRGGGARGRRLGGGHSVRTSVLRAHLDIDGTTQDRSKGVAAHAQCARGPPARRRPGAGPRTELHHGVPFRCHRADARRRPGAASAGSDGDPGGVADRAHSWLGSPGRSAAECRGAGALSPACSPRSGRRPEADGGGEHPFLPAQLRMLRIGRQFRLREGTQGRQRRLR